MRSTRWPTLQRVLQSIENGRAVKSDINMYVYLIAPLLKGSEGGEGSIMRLFAFLSLGCVVGIMCCRMGIHVIRPGTLNNTVKQYPMT